MGTRLTDLIGISTEMAKHRNDASTPSGQYMLLDESTGRFLDVKSTKSDSNQKVRKEK